MDMAAWQGTEACGICYAVKVLWCLEVRWRVYRELDLHGCEERRTHRLKRRVYINPGTIFVGIWMGMTSVNHLASLSMDASMGSAAK